MNLPIWVLAITALLLLVAMLLAGRERQLACLFGLERDRAEPRPLGGAA